MKWRRQKSKETEKRGGKQTSPIQKGVGKRRINDPHMEEGIGETGDWESERSEMGDRGSR